MRQYLERSGCLCVAGEDFEGLGCVGGEGEEEEGEGSKDRGEKHDMAS